MGIIDRDTIINEKLIDFDSKSHRLRFSNDQYFFEKDA